MAEKKEPAVESLAVPGTMSSDEGDASFTEAANVEYDEKMAKKLVRKIDLHIMPVLVILYLLSFLDRTNIGNARLANLEVDLGMTGLNYNVRAAFSNLPQR